MASAFTHAFAGLALARMYAARPMPKRFWILAAICPVLPDLDFIGFRLGIEYAAPLGHRGFTHSLLFAWLLGLLVVFLFFREEKYSARWFWLWAFFCVATATHGLLDALTNGGMGVGFFIPVNNERYFFPWTPIQVSPLSPRAFFSEWGMRVIASELVFVWLPLGLLALTVQQIRLKRTAS